MYSSESEESPSKAKSLQKRKPPAKPKATATVAPVVKTQRTLTKPAPASGQHKTVSAPKPANVKPNKFSGKFITPILLNILYFYMADIYIYFIFKIILTNINLRYYKSVTEQRVTNS